MVNELLKIGTMTGPDQNRKVGLQFAHHFVNPIKNTVNFCIKTVPGRNNATQRISHTRATSILTSEVIDKFIITLTGLPNGINFRGEQRLQVLNAFVSGEHLKTMIRSSPNTLFDSLRVLRTSLPSFVDHLVAARIHIGTKLSNIVGTTGKELAVASSNSQLSMN